MHIKLQALKRRNKFYLQQLAVALIYLCILPIPED